MKYLFSVGWVFIMLTGYGQIPDHTYNSDIRSVKLFKTGDIYSYPVIRLNSTDELDLVFDDLDVSVKNYYYTYQLCNADWSRSNLHAFDFIKGFQNVRITTYRNSSIAFTRYINYQAKIPDRNCIPSRSGNYLLKVFLDGDTSKLVFTRRFLVVDMKSSVGADVQQPFNGSIFRTHQKLRVAINFNQQVSIFNQQDIKVVILQNNNWATALMPPRPNIFRPGYFEYNDEATTSFPAGKEWRWIDLRSLRLMSERMSRIDKQPSRTDVFVKPDMERSGQVYLFYRDVNGIFTLETTDNINPFWQTDYSFVHFSYVPPGNKAYPGRDLYLFGELVNYKQDENSRMVFNEEKGVYEKTLLLKQGFYNYAYVSVNRDHQHELSFDFTEGNFWGTENQYTVLIYYRSFGARSDELIGYTTLNSTFQRP